MEVKNFFVKIKNTFVNLLTFPFRLTRNIFYFFIGKTKRLYHSYNCFREDIIMATKNYFLDLRSTFTKRKNSKKKNTNAHYPLIHPVLVDSFTKLAKSAIALNSYKIEIGHPFEDEYYFSNENKEFFSGQLNKKLIDLIKLTFRERTELFFLLQSKEIYALNIIRKYQYLCYPIILEIIPALDAQDTLISNFITNTERQLADEITIEKVNTNKAKIKELNGDILLIDDDENYSRQLFCYLLNKGYKVTAVGDLKHAVEELRNSESNYDLIISNFSFSEGENSRFIKTLRNEAFATPIIALTPSTDIEDEVKIKKLGAQIVLGKYEDPELIMAWSNSLINKY